MTDSDKLLTVDEVVELVRLHRVTVYRLARKGVIKSVKQGRQRRFWRSAINEYLDECAASASAGAPAPAQRPAAADRPARNPKRSYRT